MKPATQLHDTPDHFNLPSLLLSSSSSSKYRKQVLKYYCAPILMYGAKSGLWTRADISRPTASEMKLLRSTDGKTKILSKKRKNFRIDLGRKINLLKADSHHQHRPTADVSHLISVPPGFPGPS
jgi:hypothetical protein